MEGLQARLGPQAACRVPGRWALLLKPEAWGGGVWACKAALPTVQFALTALLPKQQTHRCWSGQLSSERGLGPTFTDHSLSLSAQSPGCPVPFSADRAPLSRPSAPAGAARPGWCGTRRGRLDLLSAHASVTCRPDGRLWTGNPGSQACARVALPPQAGGDRGLQWGV